VNSTGGLDRRTFLAFGAAATGAVMIPAGPALAGESEGARKKKPSRPDPFTLGVSSGDPTSTSVILWTRLAPKPLDLDGGMGRKGVTQEVEYEVATDERFRDVVAKGRVDAPAEFGYSVHLDLQGLTPNTDYFYRFKFGTHVTETARTRTTPAPGQSIDSFVFGQTSCANWQSGNYQLYNDLASHEPDYWLALGDYVYEYANGGYLAPNQAKASRQIPWDSEPTSLSQYRRQYGLYKSDPALQRLHSIAPYSVIWDDHEVDNNFTAKKSGGDGQKDRIAFAKRRAAGFQAFYENHAIRLPDGTPRRRPSSMRIYRRVDWGSLASFMLLDGRQYRTDQPGDDTPQDFGRWVEGMFDPNATMLGAKQEEWLASQMLDAPGRWTFISQQTVMSSMNGSVGALVPSITPVLANGVFNYDAWDGYWAARTRLAEAISAANLRNTVVLTGDFHTNLTFDLLGAWPDPRDAASPEAMNEAIVNWDQSPIGTEICAGAISSPTFFSDPLLGSLAPLVRSRTPWVKYAEFENNGYVLHRVTADEDRAEYRVCVAREGKNTSEGRPRTDKTVVIADGVPGVSEVIG